MDEIDQIDNYESLRTYLVKQPVELTVIIAGRCALRVLPFAFEEPMSKRLILSVMRASLLNWAAAKYPAQFNRAFATTAVAADAADAAATARAAADAADAADIAAVVAADAARATDSATARAAARAAAHAARAADAADIAADAAATARAAARATADAAARATARAAAYATWEIIKDDLRQAAKGQDIRQMPLWPSQGLAAEMQSGGLMHQNLKLLGSDWPLWAVWYDDICNGVGNTIFSESHMVQLLEKSPQWWNLSENDNFDAIQKQIADLVGWPPETSTAKESIPATKYASVMPNWQKSQLKASQIDAASALTLQTRQAMFEALADQFDTLAANARNAANLDHRAVKKIRDIAELARQAPTDVVALFKLLYGLQFLFDYAPTIKEQCGGVIASEFAANGVALSDALNQFEEVQQFRANLIISDQQRAAYDAVDVNSATQEFVEILRSPEMASFVDLSVPNALSEIVRDSWDSDQWMTMTAQVDAYLITDQLFSMSNIAVKLVLKAEEHIADREDQNADSLNDELIEKGEKAYEEAFEQAYIDESKNTAKQDAKIAARTVNRTIYSPGQTNSFLKTLAKKYPRIFGWLNHFVGGKETK